MKNVTIRFSRFGGDILVYSCIHVDVNTTIDRQDADNKTKSV